GLIMCPVTGEAILHADLHNHLVLIPKRGYRKKKRKITHLSEVGFHKIREPVHIRSPPGAVLYHQYWIDYTMEGTMKQDIHTALLQGGACRFSCVRFLSGGCIQ